SETTGLVKSFAYRSENGFTSEPIPYGRIAKPDCAIKGSEIFPTDIPALMNEQRTIQRKTAKAKRIHIGGEIQVYHLTKDECRIFTLDRFKDFSKTERAIYQRLLNR
ncbi:MAG: hypothetical protein WAK33_03605, partial [Silvibacterium sp.]